MANRCLLDLMTVRIPFGQIYFKFCENGLHEMHFKNVDFDLIKKSFDDKTETPGGPVTPLEQESTLTESTSDIQAACLDYLSDYFSTQGPSEPSLPPVCWQGIKTTDFSLTVLKKLYEEVAIGGVVSYKGLAELAGNPKAIRAVGSVMRRNPIALVIPCHRVLRTSPSSSSQAKGISEDVCMNDKVVGNYNGGVDIKKWLLLHERSSARNEI